MTPERFQQIERLYQAACEGTAEERAALLAQTDPELRRELESLLAQRTGGELLDRPAIQNAPELPGDLTVTALTAGACLGPYRIESKIGKGGMGEVYRASDTVLKREVALKVLPAEFARDPDRAARFQREAQLLASLNHPHIATLHGLEQSDGMTALVMELVDGPTLAERIAQGPIPPPEAFEIARQIAEALE